MTWCARCVRQRGLPALTTFVSLTSRPVFERQDFVIAGYFGEGEDAAKTYAMCCVLKPDPPGPADEVEAD